MYCALLHTLANETLCVEPFVCLFQKQIIDRELGCVALCADDIAVVLKDLHHILAVYIIFVKAELAAGLNLKPTKCKLVPLSAPLSPQLIDSITNYLRELIPAWVSFRIVGSAEYLGIWMGPNASVHNWSSQCSKFLERTTLI